VGFDEAPGEIQANAQPTTIVGGPGSDLGVQREDRLQMGSIDSHTIVTDDDDDIAAIPRRAHANHRATPTEFCRVHDEILQRLA
jgi:hypothetical protein